MRWTKPADTHYARIMGQNYHHCEAGVLTMRVQPRPRDVVRPFMWWIGFHNTGMVAYGHAATLKAAKAAAVQEATVRAEVIVVGLRPLLRPALLGYPPSGAEPPADEMELARQLAAGGASREEDIRAFMARQWSRAGAEEAVREAWPTAAIEDWVARHARPARPARRLRSRAAAASRCPPGRARPS